MTTYSETFAGSVTAVSFFGSGSGLTGITRANLNAGTPNYIVFNNASTGDMDEEQFVLNTQGGTGGDSSAATGIAHITAGVWSYSEIVNADVAAAAAIARSKLATGTVAQVVYNDDTTGEMVSEAQLAVKRGGTGQDFSGLGAGPFVLTNVSGVFSATITYSNASSNDTIAQRTGAGALAAAQIIAPSITTASGDLTVGSTSGLVKFGTSVVYQTPTTIAGGDTFVQAGNVATTNASLTTIITIPTTSGTNGTAYSVRCLVSVGNVTATNQSAGFDYWFKVKNLLGTLTASAIISKSSSKDAGLGATDVNVAVSGTNILVQVQGLAATTINWTARAQVSSQEF